MSTITTAECPSEDSSNEVQDKTKTIVPEILEDKIGVWLPTKLLPWLANSDIVAGCSWADVECTVTRPKGSFFLSDLFFVNFYTPGETESRLGCLVKLPAQDPSKRTYQDFPYSFINEKLFYEKLAGNSLDYPKYYFGGKDSLLEFVIVLENVSHRGGFFSKPKKINVELDYVTAGLKAIAKFHANSYAMKVQKPDEFKSILEKITNVRYRKNPINEKFKTCVDLRMERVMKTFMARKYESDFKQKMIKLFSECFSNVLMKCVEPSEPLATIVHGDCTINNMLYRRNEKSQELEAMLIDFATIMYCSPVIDVSTFIYMSCSLQDIIVHQNNLVKAYHDFLIAALKDREISDLTDYSYDSFWADYREKALFGYVICVFFLGTMVEYEKNQNLQQLEMRIKELNFEGGGEMLSQQFVDMLIDMREAGLLEAWM